MLLISLIVSVNNISASSYYTDDYGYRYRPLFSDTHDVEYKTTSYKDTTQYKQKTVSETKDPWSSEKIVVETSTKTSVERKNKVPIFSGYNYRYERVPSSSWRYKEPYYFWKNNNYYYKPKYDSDLGYYNWRW